MSSKPEIQTTTAVNSLYLLRWPETNGDPVCPWCEGKTIYRLKRDGVFRCKSCRKNFTVTSGTSLAFRKMPLEKYVAAIAAAQDTQKSIRKSSQESGIALRSLYPIVHKIRSPSNKGSF